MKQESGLVLPTEQVPQSREQQHVLSANSLSIPSTARNGGPGWQQGSDLKGLPGSMATYLDSLGTDLRDSIRKGLPSPLESQESPSHLLFKLQKLGAPPTQSLGPVN